MFSNFPSSPIEALEWPWHKYAPYYQDLDQRPVNEDTLESWMLDWSQVDMLVREVYSRLYVATTLDTRDEAAEKRFYHFLEEIYPSSEAAAQRLKEKLLESGLVPENFDNQIRKMRAEADLFSQDNLPLLSQEQKLANSYDKIVGAQVVEWEGKEVTLHQLQPVYQDTDRGKRKTAWRLAMARWLEDRQGINELWQEFMTLRGKLAQNAGHPDYRSYRWQQLLRLDYTPAQCEQFADAIEQVVVPAASELYEKRRRQLGYENLRPWDLNVDTQGRTALRPYKTDDELQSKCSAIFHKVDPQLGEYFETMRHEDLLDLENRKGKAPGAYCIDYLMTKRPFIFMNAVGLHDDVQTMLHETGHAFHVFESVHLPYIQQQIYGTEIAEVASMSMELLSAPYLTEDQGGFYDPAEAARARIEKLEEMLLFWPYMAVVDQFQHWVYTHHAAASDPVKCDARWDELWQRFMPGVDWSGLQAEKETGWHRKLHIHQVPFYYVDYGLAQLGAVQVWANSLKEQAGAVRSYRHALSLGATRPLPELFAAAGAKLAFDPDTLGKAVDLVMATIEELEEV
jgi:oligoendopeptidase F